jgi:hypothetical protein
LRAAKGLKNGDSWPLAWLRMTAFRGLETGSKLCAAKLQMQAFLVLKIRFKAVSEDKNFLREKNYPV